MYKHFFGLRENPFNVNPDPRYLFPTPRTQESWNELTYGIRARKGLILLTGEVGTGKTTLLHRLLDWLHEEEMPTAFIFNPHLKTGNLIDLMLADFEVPPVAASKTNALMRLNQWLIERFRAGKTPVLIVDEAQGLPTPVLEEIRMLLNLETPREKLLQIVLAGQPELEARLRRPELRQIKQRITVQCRTAALTLEETHGYIQTRLKIAGANGKPIFEPGAMDSAHFYSRGIPRVVNLLCENALISAFVSDVQPVPEQIIAEVARELQFDAFKPLPPLLDSALAWHPDSIASPAMLTDILGPWIDRVELRGKETPRPLTTRASIPFVVPQSKHHPVIEPIAPLLNCESDPLSPGNTAMSGPSSVPIALPGAPAQRQVVASGPSRWTELIPNASIRFFSGLARNPALLALVTLFHEVGAKLRFDLLPACKRYLVSNAQKLSHRSRSRLTWIAHRRFLVHWSARLRGLFFPATFSSAIAQISASLHRLLKRWPKPFHAWYPRCIAWRDRCVAIVNSMDLPQKKASLRGWLLQPWNSVPWRLPDLRWFEARRRFSQKKT